MKTEAFVFLLAVYSSVMRAQTSAAPSGDVTVGMSEGSPQYCQGPYPNTHLFSGQARGPGDITLSLPLKLLYENHRSDTIILPSLAGYSARMTVEGQNGSFNLITVTGNGMDVKKVMALSGPDQSFSIIAGGKYVWSTTKSLVEGFAVIPVLRTSSGWDLRGKTVHIVTTRDYRSLPPEVVGTLNEKWKDYGTVWTGVVDSETLTFQIPSEPLTRPCMTAASANRD
jgi:hypothetical protein